MAEVEISQIQKQFWDLQKIYRDNTAYNIPVVLRIKGTLNLDALDFAVNILLVRHEMLRTFFQEENGKILSRTVNLDSANIRIETIAVCQAYSEPGLPGEVMDEIHRVFSLSEWPLFRIRIFNFTNGISVLTIVFHHIIVDQRTRELFAKELSELYNSYRGRYSPVLNDPAFSYSDYSKWENSWLRSEEADKMVDDWKKYIPAFPGTLDLPADFPKPETNNLTGKRKYFIIDNELTSWILRFARENSVNTLTVLLTAYAIFLNRLSNRPEFIIGVPQANRRKPEFKDTFGCFVNIVPLLVRWNDTLTGYDLMMQIRQSLLAAHRLQEMPFLRIKERLGKNGANHMLQAGFTIEPPMRLSLNYLDIQPVNVEKEGAQLELFLTLWEDGKFMRGYFEYSTQLFRESTITRFIEVFRKNVISLLEAPEESISDMTIPTSDEALRIQSRRLII